LYTRLKTRNMDIDAKIIIPLIGVLLGWILGTITGFFKTRGENKKLLGKSISQLYYFIQELSIVMNYLDKMKVKLDHEKYEVHRQNVIERHTLKNENSIGNINELIDNISSISPTLGIDLRHLLEGYISERKIKFNSSKSKKELYLLLLSMYEVHQDLTIIHMEKLLIKLAFRYNLILGFKIKKMLSTSKKRLGTMGSKLIEEAYELIEKE